MAILKQAIKAVEEINSDIYEYHSSINSDYGGVAFLLLTTDGFTTTISFADAIIWNSEDDDRYRIDEELDIKEDLEEHLRGKIRELLSEMEKFPI